MGYASRLGRARISSTSPEAAAVCDRCGAVYSHSRLNWQTQYGGVGIINLRILVCDRCLDTPQPQLRALAIPADPMPIMNPRPQDYYSAETDFHMTSAPPTISQFTGIAIPNGDNLQTEDGLNMTKTPVGNPQGLSTNAVMPLDGTVQYGVAIPVLSVSSTGSDQITVTCYAPHNLITDSQVSIEGLSNNKADGFYSVVATTATVFTYQTYSLIPAGNLLQSTSRIVNAIVGLPRGYTHIVKTR